jgi:lipase
MCVCRSRSFNAFVATVVLIHGLFGAFGDKRTWSRLDPHRVLVPDLLGYGQHADSSEPVSVEAQVRHLGAVIGARPVHLVGHSVGGVIASLYAHEHPDYVLSVVNVEGNFTLSDAFWSAELAKMPESAAAGWLEVYRGDPAAWFGGTSDPYEIESAGAMLAFQPIRTLQAMAASVVEITGAPGWEQVLRELFANVPVHLVAGERSRAGWNIPPWALQAAQSYTELSGVGHAMMFQRPEAFGDVLASLLEA